MDQNTGSYGTGYASIDELAKQAVTEPDTLSTADKVRLGSWVVDRREHIQAHQDSVRIAGAASRYTAASEAMAGAQRGPLGRRLDGVGQQTGTGQAAPLLQADPNPPAPPAPDQQSAVAESADEPEHPAA